MDLKERDLQNHQALLNPQPGDYWQEMFCPYFIVVEADNKNDKYTVLSCMGGPDSFNRKHEPDARKDLDGATWCFDYGKSMVVNRAWIERAVRYESIDGFVADVVQSEKTRAIVLGWREFSNLIIKEHIDLLRQEWYNLNNAPKEENETPRDVGIRVGRKTEIILSINKISNHFGVE